MLVYIALLVPVLHPSQYPYSLSCDLAILFLTLDFIMYVTYFGQCDTRRKVVFQLLICTFVIAIRRACFGYPPPVRKMRRG